MQHTANARCRSSAFAAAIFGWRCASVVSFWFQIRILNQHWLVEQWRRPITDWSATVAPKWAIARNHAAMVEEDAIREAPVVPTGGQAGRWQAITDTTTIESSLVDWKGKGATPQDRRFSYVDCIKRTTVTLGVGVETIEPRRLGGRPSLTPQLSSLL